MGEKEEKVELEGRLMVTDAQNNCVEDFEQHGRREIKVNNDNITVYRPYTGAVTVIPTNGKKLYLRTY